jgi:hypothetical protein
MNVLEEAADILSRVSQDGKYVCVCRLLEEASNLNEPYEVTVNPDTGTVTKVSWPQFGPLIISAIKARGERK